MFRISGIKLTFILTVVVFLVRGLDKKYEQNEKILESWYLRKHPNVNNIVWKEVEVLQPQTHRNICNDVLRDLFPSFYEQFNYVYEAITNLEPKSQRVKNPVLLELTRMIFAVPLVECIYTNNISAMTEYVSKETVLYLTHCDDEYVFTLTPDKKYGDIFHLQTGVHQVHYK